MLEVDVQIAAGDWPDTVDWQLIAARAVGEAAEQCRVKLRQGAEVSVMLADDATVRELNSVWRTQDKPTNVLSFQSIATDRLATAPALGDIVLAYETIAREAIEETKSFEAHATHLLVHGFLHLIGFDHQGDADAERMESLEVAVLAKLGIADPYAEAGAPEARPA